LTRYHMAERKRRLTARTVPVSTLPPDLVGEAFVLFEAAYAGADRQRFERDLAEKQLIILLRDRETRALKGFSTVLIQKLASPRDATVVFSGDTVVHRDYWGQKQLQSAFARILLREKLRAPHRPLYWFLISKGYRTYMLLANAFPCAVPRHDVPDDPTLRRTLDTLATTRFGDEYDAATSIIRFRSAHERVRDGLAPITQRHLENRHVRFFVARNPGHVNGDELACLADVRLVDIARIALRLVGAFARMALGRRRPADAPARWTVRQAEGS
jgi:hypothetical protein